MNLQQFHSLIIELISIWLLSLGDGHILDAEPIY